MRFLTSQQIRSCESRIITGLDSSLKLIDNAAKACVRELTPFDASCVFCGKGNNGADGYRIARLLHDLGKKVSIVSVFEPKTEECRLLAEDCRRVGIEITPFEGLCGPINCNAAVDAIFGIGISGQVTGAGAAAIEYINSLKAFVLSVDIPSGLDADLGAACGFCVRADKTVTFTAPKTGMLTNESVEFCGEIVVREAGIPVDYSAVPKIQPLALTPEYAASLLPRRPRLSHKGTFGRLLVMAGSPGMMGAAIIAVRAALKSGCGLVTIVCKKGMENLLNLAVPQAVVLPVQDYDDERLHKAIAGASALLLGCGSGRSLTADFISSVLETASCPVVLDADGLNVLDGQTGILNGKNVTITPHPLEFSRLTGKSVAQTEADRLTAAKELSEELGITVLLKGARTVIAQSGDCAVSLCSTSALARGGSGDALAGVIASLYAQGIDHAAELGVYLHGLAGVISAEKCGEYSVTAEDIIENLKYSFMEVESLEQPWKSLGRN